MLSNNVCLSGIYYNGLSLSFISLIEMGDGREKWAGKLVLDHLLIDNE